jgi:Na+/melibiose symporter-like transporter
MLGGGGSFAVSGAFVDEKSDKSHVFYLMIFEASLSFISFVLVYAFFKDRSSNSESFMMLMHKTDVKNDLKEVMRNKNFIYLFLASIISCGNANFFAVTIAFITDFFGVGAKEVSILGTVSTVSGLASCLACGYLASLLGRYKKICIVTVGLGAPLYVGFFLVQGLQVFALSIIAAGLLGSCILPMYSLALELACEVAFPVREVITSGLINCFTQIFGLLPIFIAYWLGNHAIVIVSMLFFLQVVAVVLMVMVRENLRRHLMETMSFERNHFEDTMTLGN